MIAAERRGPLVRSTARFFLHVASFSFAAATIAGMLGFPPLGYRGWFLFDITVAALWWPIYDLTTRKGGAVPRDGGGGT